VKATPPKTIRCGWCDNPIKPVVTQGGVAWLHYDDEEECE